MARAVSVSYTHLDVYKRQVQYNALLLYNIKCSYINNYTHTHVRTCVRDCYCFLIDNIRVSNNVHLILLININIVHLFHIIVTCNLQYVM